MNWSEKLFEIKIKIEKNEEFSFFSNDNFLQLDIIKYWTLTNLDHEIILYQYLSV